MEIASAAALLLRGIYEISSFIGFSTHILSVFSANSCKLVLLIPFLVTSEVEKLSVFKCIEMFCNKGQKILTRNLSLIILSKLMTLSPLLLLGFYDRYVSLKKWLFWVNHILLMVFYSKNLCCYSKVLNF